MLLPKKKRSISNIVWKVSIGFLSFFILRQFDMMFSINTNLKAYMQKPIFDPPFISQDVKIVAFADHDFIEAAKWWYERMSNLTYTTHTLILIDNATETYFNYENKKREISNMTERQTILDNNSYYRTETWLVHADGLKPQQRTWTLWKRRIEYCLEQLKMGQSLLLTDVDNIFRHYEALSQFQEGPYDAIYANADKFPVPVFKRQGFALCGGMTFLKSTKGTIAMMEMILASCGERCDDQVQINLILEREMEWDFNKTSAAKGEDDLVLDGFVGNRRVSKSKEEVSNYDGNREEAAPTMISDPDDFAFKAKVWDREFAWRGAFGTDQCPPVNKNWVAMPSAMPFWLAKKSMGRGSPNRGAAKVVTVKIWEHYCGDNGTNIMTKRAYNESKEDISARNNKALHLALERYQSDRK